MFTYGMSKRSPIQMPRLGGGPERRKDDWLNTSKSVPMTWIDRWMYGHTMQTNNDGEKTRCRPKVDAVSIRRHRRGKQDGSKSSTQKKDGRATVRRRFTALIHYRARRLTRRFDRTWREVWEGEVVGGRGIFGQRLILMSTERALGPHVRIQSPTASP